MVAGRLKARFEGEAKAREQAGVSPRANLPEGGHAATGRARDQAAQLLNVSPRTVEAASRVIKSGSPELVKAVDSGQVKDRVRRTRQDIIEIGERLIEVKERLGHGRFGEWLKAEFEWSQDTAGNLINVATKFRNVRNLDVGTSALYSLSKPSVPEPARQEAISPAESGEKIGVREAKEIIEKHRPPPMPQAPLLATLPTDPPCRREWENPPVPVHHACPCPGQVALRRS